MVFAPSRDPILRGDFSCRSESTEKQILAVADRLFVFGRARFFVTQPKSAVKKRVMLVVPLLNSSTCYFSFPFILLFLSWP